MKTNTITKAQVTPAKRLQAGFVVATPGVREAIPTTELNQALNRHLRGDWGDVSPADKASNDEALASDLRLLRLPSQNRVKFWIITEGDRSVTTLILPSEY
jgi:hypothetical protein